MTETACPKCGHQFLIINLWGLPIEEEIKRLEREGHVANVLGCVPPEIGQEAFEFECQSCCHKFGEYQDDCC